MFIVESYSLAVFLCVITMLCWGSWANTQKLAGQQWRFPLFYWDYTIGVLIITLILAFTLGSSGEEGRSFLADFGQADSSSLRSAFLGGVIFNIANLLLVVAIDIAGMAVAFPVGIGLALVIGVIVNYIASPVGDPLYIFVGVALVAAAIVLDAIAYGKLPKPEGQQTRKGLIISLVAGVLMGFFYRFVAASMATDFANPEAGMLTPYTALVVFAVGIFISNFLWNSWMMYRPLAGEKVSYQDYFKLGNPKLHAIGIVGGVIWGIGMSLSIIASGSAGFAISYGLGQGATMIAAIWGVFIWKEFKGAPKGTNTLLAAMFICYLIGLILVILARL
ncbi:MAG: multidrug DMT transporter permease [Bacteroidota bacterium]